MLFWTCYKGLFIALVSLVRGGYSSWFSKTITGSGERREEDYYEANQRTVSWGYNQITVHKWTMINASSNILPWLVWQSQRMKVRTKPSTPRDWLSPKLTRPPSRKKPHTHQKIVVMEWGDEDMEFDILYNKMIILKDGEWPVHGATNWTWLWIGTKSKTYTCSKNFYPYKTC